MELREQAEILNHSNVLVLDEQTRVIMWNAGCERLYGYKSAEAIGKSADELLNTQFPVSRAEAERQLREVGVWQGELIQTARSGERVVVASDWTLYQREPDKPSVILEVNNDITGRRRAEDALMEADINKDRFLLTLGHELRNPLGAILNSVKLLRLPGITSETATRALDIIERQLNNVIRLVEDLLDVERLTRGKITLKKERVQIDAVVNNAVETAKPLVDAQGHRLEIAVPEERLFVDGDLARLGQAVANLLHNACKYSPPGSRIELTVERDGREMLIRVRDSGMGIKPETIPKLFDLYAQGSASAGQDMQGFGVGLALVRQLVELHDGSVSASSEGIDKGTEFVICLPLAGEPSNPSSSYAPIPQSAFPKRRVLIVEDNPDVAYAMAGLLESKGQQTCIAPNGAGALALAAQFKPEIAIVDIGLPDIDGYEVAKRIREILPNVILVALSGWPLDPRNPRSRQAGFKYYFIKPLAPDKLDQLLSELQ